MNEFDSITRAFGLKLASKIVPPSILIRADELIE